MKLISMTDFVLDQHNNNPNKFGDYTDMSMCILKYAKFLKQPLTLEMFIPCDEEGNVLEEPKPLGYHEEQDEYEWDYEQVREYNQAKERVLFDCDCPRGYIESTVVHCGTIEKLIAETSLEISLTPNAIKQIGL